MSCTTSPSAPSTATPDWRGSSTWASRICEESTRPSAPGPRPRSASKRVDELLEPLLQHVVAEVHDEVVVAEVVAGDQHAVGEPERRVLAEVGDLGAPPRAVADRGHDLVGGVADDDADLLDPGLDHVLDAVEEDRLVGHRHELLGAGVGDRPEPGAGAAGEDETLHRRSMVGGALAARCSLVTTNRSRPPVGSDAMRCRPPHPGDASGARIGVARSLRVRRTARRPLQRPPRARRRRPRPSRPRRSGTRGSQPIADQVAELRELKFEHPVAAEFLDDAAFEKQVTVDKGKLSKADKADIERSQGQLRAVGLIGADVDLLDATSSLQTSGVLAYYDPKTKKITVKGTSTRRRRRRGSRSHTSSRTRCRTSTSISESWRRPRPKAHGSTPLHTLVEGDAVRIENAYVQTLSAARTRPAYDEQHARARARRPRPRSRPRACPSPCSVVLPGAVRCSGPSMLDALIAKEEDAGVDALFEHPPDCRRRVRHAVDAARPPRVPDGPRAEARQAGRGAPGRPDVFGAFALFQVLASRVDNATALAAADAWDGDAMVTFTARGTTCLRSTFAGQDPGRHRHHRRRLLAVGGADACGRRGASTAPASG